MKVIHHKEVARELVARIFPRNGGYFILWCYTDSDDNAEIDNFDAAGSMRTAKRVAREGLPGSVSGPYRWEEVGERAFDLYATFTKEWDEEDWGTEDTEEVA